MKKYTLRKLGKKLLPVAFGIVATGTTSLAADAQASEIKTNTTPATAETSAVGVKIAITKETINNVSTYLESNKTSVRNQTEVVEDAKSEVNTIKNDVTYTQNEVNKLETITKEVSNEKIETAKKELETQEKAFADRISAQDALTKSVASKDSDVTSQENKVTLAQTVVDSKNKKVEDAFKSVTTAELSLADSKETELNKELVDAKTALTIAENKLVEATKKLEEAKKSDTNKSDKVSKAEANLNSAASTENSTKSELDKAQDAYEKALAELNGAKANVTLLENKNPNTIEFDSNYLNVLRQTQQSTKEGKGVSGDLLKSFQESKRKSAELNVYKKHNQDTTLYDINNLPLEVRTNLSLFFANLANEFIEKTTGQPSTHKVLKSNLDYAEKVAATYVKDNYDVLDKKNYTLIGNTGTVDVYEPRKNLEGIETVLKEYGLTSYNHFLNKYIDNTESKVAFKNSATKFTYSQLEEIVYNSVVATVFDGYAPILSTIQGLYHDNKLYIDTTGTSRRYIALDFSSVNGTLALHLLSLNHYTVFESDQNSYDKNSIKNFDKTEVTSSSNPEVLNQAKSKASELETKVANLKSAANSAQTKYNTAKSELDKAQTEYNKLLSSNSLTVIAQKEFDAAKADKVSADKRLLKAQADLANLSTDAKSKQENLSKAKTNLQLAQEELDKAKKELETEQTTLAKFNKELTTLKLALEEAKAETEDARIKAYYARANLNTLENAPSLLELFKTELAKLEADLKAKEENLAKEIATLEEYIDIQKNTERTYLYLLTKYNLENPNDTINEISFPNTTPNTDTKEESSIFENSTKEKTKSISSKSVNNSRILPKTSATKSDNNSLAGLMALGLIAGFTATRRKVK